MNGGVMPRDGREIDENGYRPMKVKAKKAKTKTPPPPAPWIAVKERKPAIYTNVLLAFEHHWNQVVGFYCPDGWYETSADDHNSKCKSTPTWWAPIPNGPNYFAEWSMK